jgi:hypothetical protein
MRPSDGGITSTVTAVERDTTFRWPCREGDFIIWFRWTDVFAVPRVQVLDFWALHDGDAVTITNRTADLPAWFALHPTEVQGLLALEMGERLRRGYQPLEIVDGPNLWRLQPGDRVAWLGGSRPGYPARDDVLALLDFRESALAAGESSRPRELEDFVSFGALRADEGSAEYRDGVARCHRAMKLVEALGLPRTIADIGEGWALG